MNKKMTITGALIILIILAGGSAYAMRSTSTAITTHNVPETSDAEHAADSTGALIAVVGEASSLDTAPLSQSWPGEVMSYATVPIQPERGGTIVEWRVKIGDRVGAGQVLARLSAPPAMPELVQMLAEQAEGRARMRAQATATQRFTEANNEQLRTLLRAVEQTTGESRDILADTNATPGTASAALAQARGAAAIMRRNLRTTVDQILATHVRAVSNANIVAAFRYGSLNLGYGVIDSQNQSDYELRLLRLIRELKDPEALPLDLVTSYLTAFVRLANTTVDGELMDIRDMAREDQETFFEMLAAYRDVEADVSMKEAEYALMAVDNVKEYAEQKREVEEKMSENEKMLAMAEAEATAADASYATVERSITSGLAIVAPRSGIISTINKKVGDFVEPGMPVASIDTARASERFVRLQIPSNVRSPKKGTVLSVVRPGFLQDVKTIELTGVGTSLDVTGAYMADARFLTPVDWPVAASVRVLVPENTMAPLITLSSVWFDAAGAPHVWGVSDAGRLFARAITIGRTVGASVEVYAGLNNGDRYLRNPTPDVREDLFLSDLVPSAASDTDTNGAPATSGGHDNMPGM